MGHVEEFYLSLEPVCKCRCSIRDHMYAENGVCACGCPEFRATMDDDLIAQDPGASMAS
ncbi:MAG TPA: hypothetical protein VET24_16395 [Actinomycetota bacterium]|nr:hypothetical protein [Actinomycetota bacterium]